MGCCQVYGSTDASSPEKLPRKEETKEDPQPLDVPPLKPKLSSESIAPIEPADQRHDSKPLEKPKKNPTKVVRPLKSKESMQRIELTDDEEIEVDDVVLNGLAVEKEIGRLQKQTDVCATIDEEPNQPEYHEATLSEEPEEFQQQTEKKALKPKIKRKFKDMKQERLQTSFRITIRNLDEIPTAAFNSGVYGNMPSECLCLKSKKKFELANTNFYEGSFKEKKDDCSSDGNTMVKRVTSPRTVLSKTKEGIIQGSINWDMLVTETYQAPPPQENTDDDFLESTWKESENVAVDCNWSFDLRNHGFRKCEHYFANRGYTDSKKWQHVTDDEFLVIGLSQRQIKKFRTKFGKYVPDDRVVKHKQENPRKTDDELNGTNKKKTIQAPVQETEALEENYV